MQEKNKKEITEFTLDDVINQIVDQTGRDDSDVIFALMEAIRRGEINAKIEKDRIIVPKDTSLEAFALEVQFQLYKLSSKAISEKKEIDEVSDEFSDEILKFLGEGEEPVEIQKLYFKLGFGPGAKIPIETPGTIRFMVILAEIADQIGVDLDKIEISTLEQEPLLLDHFSLTVDEIIEKFGNAFIVSIH